MSEESKLIVIFGCAFYVVLAFGFVYVLQLLEEIRDRLPAPNVSNPKE